MCVVFHLNGWYQNAEPPKKKKKPFTVKAICLFIESWQKSVVPKKKKSESLMNCT